MMERNSIVLDYRSYWKESDGVSTCCFLTHVLKALGIGTYSIDRYGSVVDSTAMGSVLFIAYDADSAKEKGIQILDLNGINRLVSLKGVEPAQKNWLIYILHKFQPHMASTLSEMKLCSPALMKHLVPREGVSWKLATSRKQFASLKMK